MKPLQEEIEIERVLKAFKYLYPELNVPELRNVEIVEAARRKGRCYKDGTIELTFRHDDMSCKSKDFVNTIIHELIHYNFFNLGHSEEFYCKLNDVLEKVWEVLDSENIMKNFE